MTFEPYLADSAGRESAGGQNRTQRNTLALWNVAYLIHATPLLTKKANLARNPPDEDESQGPDSVAKYVAMFLRRVEKGQCYHRPYLGCREFACNFAPDDGREKSLDWTEELGMMLYDIQFSTNGPNVPGYFHAVVRAGVMHCDTRDPGSNGEPPIAILGWADAVPQEVAP